MTLTVLDPSTGNRVTIEVPGKVQPHRTRRWVLRELGARLSNGVWDGHDAGV